MTKHRTRLNQSPIIISMIDLLHILEDIHVETYTLYQTEMRALQHQKDLICVPFQYFSVCDKLIRHAYASELAAYIAKSCRIYN